MVKIEDAITHGRRLCQLESMSRSIGAVLSDGVKNPLKRKLILAAQSILCIIRVNFARCCQWRCRARMVVLSLPAPRYMSDSPAVLASLHDLVPGELLGVEARLGSESESLLLYRDGDDVRAWLNVCPHAGRRLDWAPGQFLKSREGHLVCAAHGAAFDLQAGQCVSGPCRGESLHAVPVTVRAGQVVLV